ncbi:MAG TPA: ChuX/HutX family heme-like substrate-binding protein [Nitrospira sp.]|nr:ChuX/HutX family heme-like substrate-binding protein [Nitrospira sp.]
MRDPRETFTILEEAMSLTETSFIVRTATAIVEMRGPLKVALGKEWATIGEKFGSHIHLRMQSCHALRYTPPNKTNAALEVRSTDGELVCRLSFRGTDPSQTERYDAERAANVHTRFARLAEEAS